MIKKAHAFTIVELLIVIVVIAILAAISIIAYRGIQDRATNTSIINSVSQTLKMIQAYVAETGEYPELSSACVTSTTGCADANVAISSSPIFDTNMQKVGTPPKSTATLGGTTRYGVIYTYQATRTLDSQSRPAILLYYLQGINQSCGMAITSSYGPVMATTSSRYTGGNSGSSGKTACVVSIPGPGA